MRRVIILPAALLVLLFSSCSKSSSDTTNNGNTGGTTGGTPGPFFLAVKSVLSANCAVSGCHASPNPQNGIDFADNATIVAKKDRIKVRAVDLAGTADQMPKPPRAPLSADDQKKITDWITAGGKLTN